MAFLLCNKNGTAGNIKAVSVVIAEEIAYK